MNISKEPKIRRKPAADMEMANRIAFFRKKYIAESQAEAGRVSGVSQATFSQMESGAISPSTHVIQKLVKEYRLNTQWLASGDKQLSPVVELKPVESEGKLRDKTMKEMQSDLNNVTSELQMVKSQMEVLQANLNHLFKVVEGQNK